MQPRMCNENGSLIYLILRVISYGVSFFLFLSSFLTAILFIPFKYFVGMYLKKKYKHPIEFLDGLHTIFSMDNDSAPLHIQVYQVFTGNADIERLRQRVKERWLRQKDNLKFRYILKRELGYYFWLPNTNLQLESHILIDSSLQPKNMAELHLHFSDLSTSLPVKKEIFWQIFVIDLPDIFPGYKSGPKHILCANFHHSFGDGITLTRFMYDLYDNLPDDSYIEAKPSIPFINQIKYFVEMFFKGPFMCAQDAIYRERHQLLGPLLTGVKLISIADPIPIVRLQNIANRTGTNLNNVLTTCIVGGLRSYFLSERISIPSIVRFLRPILLHGSPIYKRNKLINKVSFACYTLPIEAAISLDRLRLTTEMMNNWETNPSTYLTYLFTLCCFNLYPSFVTRYFMNGVQTSGVLAHINGVKDDGQTLLGNELMHTFATASATGISGIAITSVTANGFATFGLKVDAAIMKDQDHLDKFVGFIVTEFYNLESDSEKCKGYL